LLAAAADGSLTHASRIPNVQWTFSLGRSDDGQTVRESYNQIVLSAFGKELESRKECRSVVYTARL